VGLTGAELEYLGREGAKIRKVSTRDLPYVVARQLDGATTVASTMRIAAMAGIAVFATGGIGGVHRGAEKTFDMSADLTEFAASDVAVVTAGAKAILDLGLTLETLETLGVPVIGLATDRFPAFYSRAGGHAVPMRCETPKEIAAVMRAKWVMGLKGGIVVANPIPAEFRNSRFRDRPPSTRPLPPPPPAFPARKSAIPAGAARNHRRPFARRNIALVGHNAGVAAEIAVEFSRSGQ
jgi:pseudouridine-5'-phosphate glycosidase